MKRQTSKRNGGELFAVTDSVQRIKTKSVGAPIQTIVIITFIAVAIIATIFQLTKFVSATQYGLPIPDSVVYARTLTYWEGARNLFNSNNYIIGITAIYGWTWSFTPLLCVIINVGLILIAWYLSQFVERQKDSENLAQFGLFLNGYLILAIPGPNKEIPLVAATLGFLCLTRSRSWVNLLCAMILALFCYSLRDGYGAFMAFWALMTGFVSSARLKAGLVALGSVVLVIAQPALSSFRIFARNISVAESITGAHHAVGGIASQLPFSSDNPLGALILFFIRLAYNWGYLALNPILFTVNGNFYALGWAYWLFGISILFIIPAAVANLVDRKHEPINHSASFVVATWLIVSLSLYAQPRYLMPIMPIGMAILINAPIRRRRGIMMTASVIMLLFISAHIFTGKTERVYPEKYSNTDYYQRP